MVAAMNTSSSAVVSGPSAVISCVICASARPLSDDRAATRSSALNGAGLMGK